MERRKVSYKEFDQAEIGYCILITGGMMSPPVAIVERPDGTMVELPIHAVQFLDIPQWANLPENKESRMENRVLTLEEVKARCQVGDPMAIQLWDESEPFYIIGFPDIYQCHVQVFHGKAYREGYGSSWRAWTNRPTVDEMAANPWSEQEVPHD